MRRCGACIRPPFRPPRPLKCPVHAVVYFRFSASAHFPVGCRPRASGSRTWNTSRGEMLGHMDHKRRLLTAMAVSGGIAAGVGTFALPASAAVRTFEITLVGKIKKTVTVDVGLDTPLDQIRLPNLGLPILSIRETTPAQAPPSNGPSLTIKPTPTQTPAAPATPAAPQAGEQIVPLVP